MNAFDYYVGLSEKEKGLARGRDGRRQFLEMGMGFWEMETWLGWQGRAAISPDMALFILPNGAGVRDSCLRAMVLRLVDSRNLFVNTGGDRAIVNVYSTRFAMLLNEIDAWLENDAMTAVWRRFSCHDEGSSIEITLGELPEEIAFGQDIVAIIGSDDVDDGGGYGELFIRFNNAGAWTSAAATFTEMYEKFLADGFYSIKTVEIERVEIEEEITNEFCGRCLNYIYDETGEGIDKFVLDFFGMSLADYVAKVADLDFEWKLGEHYPMVNMLDPWRTDGARMAVNTSYAQDMVEEADAVSQRIIDLYNKHWAGEIALPALNQPRLLEVSNE